MPNYYRRDSITASFSKQVLLSWIFEKVTWRYVTFRLVSALCLALTSSPCAPVVCAGCHPAETASFSNSAMGRSIGLPARITPQGRVTNSDTGTVIDVTWTNSQMGHRLTELGFRADYSIGFQIGAGKVGHSYIAQLGQYLLQSPASYYNRYGWDISPGFKDAAVLDFDRVLGAKCLFCHAKKLEFLGSRQLVGGAKIEAIDCARCHGDTSEHLNHPSRSNIVNPARLDVRARDSVCEQCHLEGLARVLNPGKALQDFRAGAELESTLSVYVDDQRQAGAKVVSQVEQLGLSRCARESGGKLWCGTCHDPHSAGSANRTRQIAAICSGCHASFSQSNHPSAVSDCAGCHMPRLRPNDVAHAASTDHRILARPNAHAGNSVSESLRAWHEPDKNISQRNLGLAELEASANPAFHSLGDAARGMLETLPADQRESDPVVLAALGDLALARRNQQQGAALFRRASELAPANAEYFLYLGIASKKNGDLIAAEDALKKAIALDASLQEAYLELSALFSKQGKARDAAAALDDYLKWNSQSIVIRTARDAMR